MKVPIIFLCKSIFSQIYKTSGILLIIFSKLWYISSALIDNNGLRYLFSSGLRSYVNGLESCNKKNTQFSINFLVRKFKLAFCYLQGNKFFSICKNISFYIQIYSKFLTNILSFKLMFKSAICIQQCDIYGYI